MGKDIVIMSLLVIIVTLLVIIAYLMGRDSQPQPEPEPLPEFPADEILEAIRKDFDNVVRTSDRQSNDTSSRLPRERLIQGTDKELTPIQEQAQPPEKKPPQPVFKFKPDRKRKGKDKGKGKSNGKGKPTSKGIDIDTGRDGRQ